jgi:hypothetical protein
MRDHRYQGERQKAAADQQGVLFQPNEVVSYVSTHVLPTCYPRADCRILLLPLLLMMMLL